MCLTLTSWHLCVGILAIVFSSLVSAATTYNGTNGVREKLLINNSVSACSGCHFNGALDPDFTSSYDAFSNYAIVYHGNNKLNAVQTMIDRTSLPTNDPSFMPQGGLSQISADEMALLAAWKTNGAVEHDNPTTTTLSTISNKGKVFKTSNDSSYFTVYANVDDSGIDATSYSIQYGLSQSPSFESSTQTVDGSGGGAGTTQITQQLTNLDCGDIYYYRVKASNDTYVSTTGGWQQEATPDCNTPPVIQNPPFSLSSATEDTPYQFSAAALDSEGDNINYSLNNAPTGMVISDSGLIQWTPLEGVTSSGLVTVTAADNGADGVVADSENFTLSVTQVNDAPQINSIAKTSAVEGNLYSYQLVVIDPDDSGLELNYQVAPITGDMLISSSGLLTWTPENGITSSGTITVTVSDGGEDGALAATQVFEILVSGVNTPPSITSSPVTSAQEDVQYQYQLEVLDLDDANNGSDLLFSLSNQPSAMTISNTGLIQWTPLEGQRDLVNVEVIVADGGENSSLPDNQIFSISVQSINDAPQLTNPGEQVITELDNLVLDLSLFYSDPDDDNDGKQLTWQLINGPQGMQLSALGNLTWQSQEQSAGSYDLDISLADGGEDGAAAASLSFLLTVNLLDTDSDLIADYLDNCILVANNDQLDFDQDQLGDVCDSDDDNDGLPDTVELANELNPMDASDALLDSDGDGESNQQEYLHCAQGNEEDVSQCLQIQVDSVPPVITSNGSQSVISQGYFTPVNVSAQAFDVKDGELEVSADFLGPFRPGKHTVIWQAQDQTGNVASLQQEVIVKPRIELTGSTLVLASENSRINIPLSLSGPAPEYPVLIDYQVSGSASREQFDLTSGQIAIQQGLTADLVVNWLASVEAESVEAESDIEIRLIQASDSVFLADDLNYQIHLIAENIAPRISLTLSQAGEERRVLYQDLGDFIIRTQISDSSQQMLINEWQSNHDELQLESHLMANEINQFQLDPNLFEPGFYSLTLISSDGELTDKKNISFRIEAEAPILTAQDTDNDGIGDNIEGLLDSDNDGIQDYLDPIDDPQYMHKTLLQNDLLDSSQQLLQTQAGLVLKAGPYVIENGQAGVALPASLFKDLNTSLATNSSDFNLLSVNAEQSHHTELEQQGENHSEDKTIIGKVIDLEIHDVNSASNAQLVIPLTVGIPMNGEYWLYQDEQWREFNISSVDSLASAFRQQGYCPSIESTDYQLGLMPFAQCLLVTIKDGGINDADGSENGVVVNTGALLMDSLFVVDTEEGLIQPSNSPGAGHVSWFLLLFSLLFVASRAQAEFNIQPLIELSAGRDDNISRGESEENSIEDNFVRLDALLIMDYEIHFNKSISLELKLGQQEQQETQLLGRKEIGGRLIYRWQNSFHYNSPWYQIFSDITIWDFGKQQRDSTLYTQQAMASARLTTRISGSIGGEYKVRDSESRVYDNQQSRAFLHLDYTWSDNLSLYSGYSYLVGDIVTSAQSEYCNGLTATSVYYLLNAAQEVEQDSILNASYCGNWISYRLPATSQVLTLGANLGFGHSSSIDLSWLYATIEADAGNRYQRNILQVNYLKAF